MRPNRATHAAATPISRALTTLLVVAVVLAGVAGAAAARRGSTALACTDSWTNASGGNWLLPGNWSNGVPTSGSQVCITLDGTYTVEITAAAGTQTIGGLTLGAATANTQTLQIDSGAQLNANGTSNNQAGGAIANNGVFVVGANQTFNEGAGTTSGNPITINDAFLNFTVAGGGGAASFAVTNAGNSAITGNTSASESVELNSATVGWTGTSVNAGTISAAGSGTALTVGSMTNTGLIRSESGATGPLTMTGTLTSSGTIEDDSAFTWQSGTLTNTGAITVAASATFSNSSTLSNNTGGSIANSGTFTTLSNHVFNEGAGTTSGNPLRISNAFLNFTVAGGGGAASFAVTNAGNSDISGNSSASESVELNSATVSWTGTSVNAGTISAAGSGTALTVGSMTNTGLIRSESGATGPLTMTGTLTSSGTIEDDSAFTWQSGTLTNTGAITVAAGATFSNSSTLSNNTGGSIANSGTFTTLSNQIFNEGAGTTSGNPLRISNAFLNFTVAGGGGAASFAVTNAGNSDISGNSSASESVELNSATVSWTGTSVNAGTISAAGSGTALTVGSMTNTGLIRSESGATGPLTMTGTLTSSGTIEDDSAFTWQSGTLTNTGAITVAASATFSNSSTLSNNTGGSIANSGTFTTLSNHVFNEGAGTTSGNPLRISNAFLNFTVAGGGGAASFAVTNAGTSALTGTIGAGQSLALQSGASASGNIVNNGTVDSQATGAATTLTGSVTNNGIFHVESGAASNVNGSFVQGSTGTLAVDLADPVTFGHLVVSGTATLDGNLSATTTGFSPTAGTGFKILSTGSTRSGSFATYAFTGHAYTAQYNSNNVTLIAADQLVVTTTSLPAGALNTAYTGATLASSGGTGAVTWSVPPNTLPPGLSLNTTTGAITGTPTAAGAFPFTVTATDSGSPAQTTHADLSITIAGQLLVTTTSLPGGVVGTSYTGATLASSGGTGAVSWSVPPNSLPPGLSLNTTTGAITGTPTAAGSFPFTVTATDSGSPQQTAHANLSITIAGTLLVTTTSLHDGIVGTSYTGATLASSGGTGAVTWSVPANTLPPGLSLSTGTGAITGTPTAAGTYPFTATATDSGSPAQVAHANLSITVATALQVTTTSLPSGIVGSVYSGATLGSSGGTGAVTWSVPANTLPAGLSLNTSTGAISGMPTAAGTAHFTVTATDSGSPAQTAHANLAITIVDQLQVTTTSLPSGTVGTAYAGATLHSTGGTGAVTWSVPPNSLPAGLSLNATTGAITGTPTAAGTSHFTVEATDSGTPVQTANANLSIAIASASGYTVTLTSSPNPSIDGQTVTFTATVTPALTHANVLFYDGATKLGSVNNVTGTVIFRTSKLAVGSHQMTAVLQGRNISATSDPLTQVVNPKTVTATQLFAASSAGPPPKKPPKKVTLQAEVTPHQATGKVTFYDGAIKLSGCTLGATGICVYTTPQLSPGIHHITGQYSGDALYAPSTSPPLDVTIGS